jgi:hypothetical protein
MPTCPAHPKVQLTCPACVGGRGGRVKSPRKTAAAKRNILARWAKRKATP